LAICVVVAGEFAIRRVGRWWQRGGI